MKVLGKNARGRMQTMLQTNGKDKETDTTKQEQTKLEIQSSNQVSQKMEQNDAVNTQPCPQTKANNILNTISSLQISAICEHE